MMTSSARFSLLVDAAKACFRLLVFAREMLGSACKARTGAGSGACCCGPPIARPHRTRARYSDARAPKSRGPYAGSRLFHVGPRLSGHAAPPRLTRRRLPSVLPRLPASARLLRSHESQQGSTGTAAALELDASGSAARRRAQSCCEETAAAEAGVERVEDLVRVGSDVAEVLDVGRTAGCGRPGPERTRLPAASPFGYSVQPRRPRCTLSANRRDRFGRPTRRHHEEDREIRCADLEMGGPAPSSATRATALWRRRRPKRGPEEEAGSLRVGPVHNDAEELARP